MNRKKSSLCYLFLAFLLGGVFVLTSCDKGNDVYNPNHIQEEAKKAFPVKDIDPNQTWEMSSICNASVSVNEKTGGAYTIKVYTENPYNTNGNAFLLAKTSVTDGQTVNFKFDIPAALQYVYVMKVNSEGYSSVIPATVENGVMKVTFGETGTTRATTTKADGDSFFKPELPKDNIFPTTPPANCGNINDYKGSGPYLLNGGTYRGINPSSGADIYIQGNVTLSSWSEPSGITNIYLLPNATLTLEMGQFNHRHNSIFSIGAGAKLIALNTVLKGEEGSKIFNKGTISAKNIELTNSYWYNASLIETEKVLFTNSASKFCNAPGATLKASELIIAGNGHFLNETDGVVEVAGKTTLNCSSGSWENAGHYTTGTMDLSAWNQNLKNACWLYVKGKLEFHEAGIYNESYIVCNEFHMQNSRIHMGAQSFFEIKETATFIDNWGSNKGFIASATNEWALIKMGKATSNNHQWRDILYDGKIYIACNDHFTTEDQTNTFKLDHGARLASANGSDISIPSSNCNPGYNSTPNGGTTDKVQTYAYVFEDMMTEVGDYDFNDVVLYVTVPYDKDGKKVVDATLKAAGATKQLTVLFKDNGTAQTIFEDVHNALGVSAGTITNTGGTIGVAITKTIEVRSDFNLTSHGDFYISDGKREIHIPNFTSNFQPGNAPYALRIATNWKWPKERIQITEAYPDFAGWVQDATTETNWHNKYVSDKVID